jgi:AAA+ superfamily predicted ATPase
MLLDEADVYVHERGRDMQQNAIVGVFLRVLEYQDSVLFLTTNRPDDVDDAVASRCVARLNYRFPSQEEQREIWSILSKNSNILLSQKNIEQIVAENPGISGRDIKNLLKLALLVRGKKPIRPEDIEFVRQFQPTRGITDV